MRKIEKKKAAAVQDIIAAKYETCISCGEISAGVMDGKRHQKMLLKKIKNITPDTKAKVCDDMRISLETFISEKASELSSPLLNTMKQETKECMVACYLASAHKMTVEIMQTAQSDDEFMRRVKKSKITNFNDAVFLIYDTKGDILRKAQQMSAQIDEDFILGCIEAGIGTSRAVASALDELTAMRAQQKLISPQVDANFMFD